MLIGLPIHQLMSLVHSGAGHRRLRETWQIINDQIGDNKWILGDQFSAADIYLFMLTTWLEPLRGQPEVQEFPNVKRIADAVSAATKCSVSLWQLENRTKVVLSPKLQ